MKPLEGVKVLEFSTMITASFAAMMMAEQGATVIKVEPIELGDPMRFLGSSKGGISVPPPEAHEKFERPGDGDLITALCDGLDRGFAFTAAGAKRLAKKPPHPKPVEVGDRVIFHPRCPGELLRS